MKKESIFWGVLFVLSGVCLIVSKLGYLPNVNVFSLLLTVFLAVVIAKSIIRLNFTGILFPAAFICIIYDKQLGITAITPWTVLGAALLGSVGFTMIFHKHIKWISDKCNHDEQKFVKVDVQDESHIEFKNSFAASAKYVNTDKFEQADFSCSFGAMKIYFDNVTMKNESAVVSINASFSGIELYIPKTWHVDNKANVFLGAIEEKNKNNQAKTNTLTLVGDISLSGIEIIYV